MEFDLAPINKELAQSIPAKGNGNSSHKVDDATLPPSSRLKTIEEMVHQGSPKISDLTKDISDMKIRHAEEIGQWKEYEARIQAWKQQVQDIFQNLKTELLNKHEQGAELAKAKIALQAKQKELEMLRFYIENKEGKEALDRITEI